MIFASSKCALTIYPMTYAKGMVVCSQVVYIWRSLCLWIFTTASWRKDEREEKRRGMKKYKEEREGKKRLKEGRAGNCRFVFLMVVLSGRGKILSPRKQEKGASTTHLTAKLFCYLMIPFREPLCSLPAPILCQINTLFGPSYPSSLWNTKINVPYLQISLF